MAKNTNNIIFCKYEKVLQLWNEINEWVCNSYLKIIA